jgi:hypothetical protein
MTNPIAIKYPLDLTGINPNNLVISEPHTLLNNPNRAVVCNYGPFYAQGLIIVDQATGNSISPVTQYTLAQLHEDLTTETGLEVEQVIIIVDPSVSNNIAITYQAVGGEYAWSVDALIQMLAALQIDDRAVAWGQILGKPSAYAPTQHLHDIGDTYGWEYVVDALQQVKQAILIGDQAAIDAMLGQFQNQVTSLQTVITGYNNLLEAHISNYNNPHQTNAEQVGLGNVQNYGIATQADCAAGTSNTLYVTPFGLVGATNVVMSALEAHITNYQNPHQTNAEQVGLGLVNNYATATIQQAQAGTASNLYVTPQGVAAAVTTQAYAPLSNEINAHISNLNNPHQTTATQVGLGNVPNYGLATTAQAQAGTVNTAFMTPALVAAAVTTQALTPLNAHISNISNPHQTTAAQVGLGNCNNTSDLNKPISTATQAALNNKASLGAAVEFSAISINTAGLYLYDYNGAGGLAVRTGTGSALSYSTLDGSGNFTIGGKMVAGAGFQPSDKRLKEHIEKTEARALWRHISYKSWFWKDIAFNGDKRGKEDHGWIAQDVMAKFPEYAFENDVEQGPGKKKRKVMNIDKAGLAFEMSIKAGQNSDLALNIVNDLRNQNSLLANRVEELERIIKKLAKGG